MTITKHLFMPEFMVTHDSETETYTAHWNWSGSHQASYDKDCVHELEDCAQDAYELTSSACQRVDEWLADGVLPDGVHTTYTAAEIKMALQFLTTLTNTSVTRTK